MGTRDNDPTGETPGGVGDFQAAALAALDEIAPSSRPSTGQAASVPVWLAGGHD